MLISEYLELFMENQAELMKLGKASVDYDDNVATTWEMSFKDLKRNSPAAADLLNLCAFLAPDDIPLDVISNGAKHLPERLAKAVRSPLEFDNACAALKSYSLADVSGETLSVHRLVQTVTRDRLSDGEKREWAGAAVKIVNKAFPRESDDVRTWAVCGRLLSHALASARHTETLSVAHEATSRLLNNAGSGYLGGRAEFDRARTVIERALKIDEAAYGSDHPNIAACVNNLGSVLHDMGDLEGAKMNYERALKIDEAKYGPDHPDVAIDVNNLGSVLKAMGDLKGAEEHFERALKIGESAYGPDHTNVAAYVNNLGSVLKAMGDLKGAEEHFERALKIDEAACGSDHPNVANDVNNIGSVLKAMGDLKGAEEHFVRALGIVEKCFGEKHPKTIIVRENLESLEK